MSDWVYGVAVIVLALAATLAIMWSIVAASGRAAILRAFLPLAILGMMFWVVFAWASRAG